MREFLVNYPDNLGMNRITEPKVLEYIGPNAEESGISGFVIIAKATSASILSLTVST